METESETSFIKPTVEETFISTMSPLQQKAYHIALEQLKTSFDISRCNGLAEFIQSKNKLITK